MAQHLDAALVDTWFEAWSRSRGYRTDTEGGRRAALRTRRPATMIPGGSGRAAVDVPATWECRCGATAVLRDHEKPEEKPGKPQRTHWDMLLERRSEEDLQVLLDQRLELLRAGRLHSSRTL